MTLRQRFERIVCRVLGHRWVKATLDPRSVARLSLWSAVTPEHLDVRIKPNIVKPGGGR